MADNSAGGPKKRVKRAKIAAACQRCRDKKIRCDGQRPACGSCLKRGLVQRDCVYTLDGGSENAASQRQYIRQLEHKIRELKQQRYGGLGYGLTTHSTITPLQANTLATGSNHGTRPFPVPVSIPLEDEALGFLTPVDTNSGLDDLASVDHVIEADSQVRRPSNNVAIGIDVSHARSMQHVPGEKQLSAKHSLPQLKNPTTGHAALCPVEPSFSSHAINATDTTETEEDLPILGDLVRQSSSAYFLKQVHEILQTKRRPGGINYGLDTQARPLPSQLMPSKKQPIEHNFLLPVRSTADRFMTIYWTEVHTLHPVIHRPTFQAQYEALWTDNNPSGGSKFHCILNTLFAIACQLDPTPPPEAREAASASYFGRAKNLLQFDILESGTFEVVQALLLMGQYLQSTNNPSPCWCVVGLAIRTAQGLGLHQEGTHTTSLTQQDREMFRRVWHGCVLMDRVVSLSFGLPAMIQTAFTTSVPLPTPIDDEYLSAQVNSQGMQPPGQPSQMEYLRATLNLYEILSDIRSQFYHLPGSEIAHTPASETQNQNVQHYQAVIYFERRLTAYWQSLPLCLTLSSELPETTAGPIFALQSNVIRARFLYTRLVLLRPMLAQINLGRNNQARESTTMEESSVERSLLLRSAVMCVSTAQELIALVFEKLSGNDKVLPSWWYNVFFVYTAAIVLVAARLCPPVLAETSEKGLDRPWQQCIQVLQKYEKQSWSARKCIAVLELLSEKGGTHLGTRNSSAYPMGSSQFTSTATARPAPEQSNPIEFEDNMFLGTVDLDWDWLTSVPFDLDSPR